ncbi:MAG: hypothetical protein QOE51_3091 [Actinoplanes sp.]|jgi:hypothetical protein|nr:hypothetical protein [Actinoplanes sp.]
MTVVWAGDAGLERPERIVDAGQRPFPDLDRDSTKAVRPARVTTAPVRDGRTPVGAAAIS